MSNYLYGTNSKSLDDIIQEDVKNQKILQEKKEKEEEELKKYIEKRNKNYIENIKTRVFSIISSGNKYQELLREIDSKNTIFGIKIDYAHRSNERIIFEKIEEIKIRANMLGKYFERINQNNIKKYFENYDLNNKFKKETFINFIVFVDYLYLVNLIIKKSFYECLNDELKKLFRENCNESIIPMIEGKKSVYKNSPEHEKWRKIFSQIKN